MIFLGGFAMGLWTAMWKLYDKNYGPTAKQIKALRKDVERQQKRIDELEEENREISIENAKLKRENQILEDQNERQENKIDEIMAIFNEPVEQPDDPWKDPSK